MKKLQVKDLHFIFILAGLYTVIFNITFFEKLFATYHWSIINTVFFASVALIIFFLVVLILNLFRFKYLMKAVCILLLLCSSLANFTMMSYGVAIDYVMILNIFSTQKAEVLDLFSLMFCFNFLLLGVVPSVLILKIRIVYLDLKNTVFSQLKVFFGLLFIMLLVMALLGKSYTSFFREHKPLRYYINPTAWIYAVIKYSKKNLLVKHTAIQKIGNDSVMIHDNKNHSREIVVLVIGESARGDHVSLNGYNRDTFPLLAKEDVLSFSNMVSCGTSTAVSVPCIFSHYNIDNFDSEKGRNTENVLDIMNRTGKIKVLWRDNNSDSKGVALRLEYQDYKSPDNNPSCHGECRDIGMINNLEQIINNEKNNYNDILIVLHQMGNHGPAYYKRYPKEFEKFVPACQTNELQECTRDEIINAYDNALLYTVYFLSEIIKLLKKFPLDETALLYVSDHGESLGENGVYLHGMPEFIAPKEQKDIASIFWFGGTLKKKINWQLLKRKSNVPLSHDIFFHTLLGLFEIKTKYYRLESDVLYGSIYDVLD